MTSLVVLGQWLVRLAVAALVLIGLYASFWQIVAWHRERT